MAGHSSGTRTVRGTGVLLPGRRLKIKAVAGAFLGRRKARVILIWHLHLLKLLPVVSSASSRVVLFLHGTEAWCKVDRLLAHLLRRVDLIISNTDHTWRTFIEHNPQFQAIPHEVVHLGTGTCHVNGTPPPDSQPTAVMVSRLDSREDYKGHRQIINVWPRVQGKVPGARLWVIGSGDLQPQLAKLGAATAPGAIEFFGPLQPAKKEDVIARSRFLAMPSRGEGFGLVYLEAMRLARPCLVSDSDAGREVVNPPEAGLQVNPDDPLALADALIMLFGHGSDWDSWSARARARYERYFTLQHFHARLMATLF